MKSILSTLTIILCLSFISFKTYAQHAGISVHALYATPVGSISNNAYNGGIGVEGSILAGRRSSSSRFVGTIGYSRFFSKSDNDFGDKTYVPIKVGMRQFFPLTLNRVFVQGDAGIGLVSYHQIADTETPFAFDLQAGIRLVGFEALIGWDTFHSQLWNGWSSWFTIKAGINLGF